MSTITSTGAVNGEAVNVLVVDGGSFRIGAVAIAAAQAVVGVAAVAVKRTAAIGAASVNVSAALMAVRRAGAVCASRVGTSAAVVAVRRAFGVGASSIAVNAALAATRRTRGMGAALVSIGARARARYRVLRRSTVLNTYTVPHERREYIVPPEPVAPALEERRSYLVGSQRRDL